MLILAKYFLEVIMVLVPMLMAIAYFTLAERKTMGSMQRRIGPNIVGYYGILQAFADALKLIIKEYVSPTQANILLFFLGPIITLIFSLLNFAVIPFNPGLAINDFYLGILYFLAISSLSTYGILLAGWSANSKYAFLGSLRSTAQLISYELVLSSSILIIILLAGNLNFTACMESQRAVLFVFPLFPIFLIFLIAAVAETNRAPFDLAEAESELVSGFMTEHAAVIFVFFFLAEYGSILLMCILTNILFFGGYLFNNVVSLAYHYVFQLEYLFYYAYVNLHSNNFIIDFLSFYAQNDYLYSRNLLKIILDILIIIFIIISELLYFFSVNSLITPGLAYGLSLGIKTGLLIFFFIWVRASFPRIRFDQLMSYCWTVLLPVTFGFIIYIPCMLYCFNIFSVNINIL